MSGEHFTTVKLSGLLSIVSTSRQEGLIPAAPYEMTVEADMSSAQEQPTKFQNFIEDALRDSFTKHFNDRLHHDARLRKKIGSVAWQAKLHEYTYTPVEGVPSV